MNLNKIALIKNIAAATTTTILLSGASWAQTSKNIDYYEAVGSQIAQSPTLSKIANKGEIVITHTPQSYPFTYLEGESKIPRGYVIEICLKIAENIKAALKRPDIKIKYYVPEKRLYDVADGKSDLECMASTNIPARQEIVSFSPHYFVTNGGFAIKKDSKIRSLKDLNGKKVAMWADTSQETIVTEIQKAKNIKFTVVPMKSPPDGLNKLMSGEVDAVFSDESAIWGAAAYKLEKPEIVGFIKEKISVEPYGIVYKKNDKQMGLIVDNTVLTLFKTGEIRKLYAKWFTKDRNPPYPMTIMMRENIRHPSKIGQEYYGLKK